MSPISTPPAPLTWSGVTARRMARHALTAPATGLGPPDIARVLCGAHAQVLSAAELSIGRRIAGATRADVRRALWEDRTLVKTFGPRGTIHLLATADLPMWTGALSALPSSVPLHPEPVRFPPDQADEVVTALRTLVTRYLYAFGPATPQHLARWLSIPPGRAAELFDELADELQPIELDGEPGWVVAGDTETPQQPHRGVRLLPYFDAFVVAGQPRERLYPGPVAARGLTPAGQAGNYPVLLVDGVVGGVWHQRRSGRNLAITVEPLGDLTATQRRQLDDEVELVAVVQEATPTLTVGPVTVGPHA